MKARHCFLPLLAISAGFATAATNQYWNVGSTGGDGIWGTGPGDKNWNLTPGAAAGNTTWADPTDNIAVFQDAGGGTVTVLDTVQTNGLSQTGANYTLDAGVITLVSDAASSAPFVNVQTGTLIVNSALAGTSGLVKTGAANLLLTAANPFTGPTAVNAGTLTLTGSLASTGVQIASGATLTDANGGLAPATALTNAGTLTVNAAETIASLANNAGTVNGTGTLTLTGATIFTGGTLAAPLTLNGTGGGTFTNAILAGTFNGTATLDGATVSGTVSGNTTSTGNTLVSGNLGGGSLAVNGGTLTLTGTSTNATITLAAGAGLVDQSGGLDAATVLANAGTLTVNAAETIATYTQAGTGSLTGTGFLTASGGATLNGGTVSGHLLGNITSNLDVLVSGSLGGGSLAVTGGTLTLTGTSTNSTVNLAAGASLVDQSGGLDAATVLANAGTLTVNSADTIASLTNTAGTVNGTGTLTVTGATVFNGGTLAAPLTVNGTGGGTFANALLAGTFNGTAALDGATVSGALNGPTTSIGNTLVSGNIGGGSLAVTGGTLTLTGASTNTPVTVALGANLVDQGNLSDTATVTNVGHFSVNTADTIGSLSNNAGSVNGSGTLTVTGPTLFNGGTLAAPLTVNGTGGGTFTNAILAGTFNGTAALDGSTVSGTLSGNTTSTGNTLVSGSIGGGSLNVTGGVLNLSGTSTNTPVAIGALATLVDANGGLASSAALTNAGILTVNAADTITSLANNAGTINGTGTLNITGATIFTGGTLAAPLTINGTGGGSFTNATIAGIFNGNTTSTGNTLVSGSIGGGSLNVAGGVLNLTGSSINNPVTIGALATLVDANGGLASSAAITNAGILTVNAADTIATYLSNGGSLTGPALLTTISTTLNTGSSVSGYLNAGTLTSNGAVAISGSATAVSFSITSGVLSNTGTLAATQLNITGGATLIAGGTQTYNLLTTSGAGAGTWQGNLNNPTVVAPGGVGATGSLAVTGNFSNAPTGALKLDLGAAGHDLVTVGGTATFGGTLDLNQLSPIAPFVPVQVVAAGSYAGNFTTLAENLDGAAWFNPGNGTVMTLALPTAGGSTLYGTTANQTATWVSLYDDVIDPGVANVTALPSGGYQITSGIANAGNPDLLNTLAASFVAGGLNTAVLDRLSPEVYGGFQDYAIQATRSHQRAALDAPSLGFIQAPRNPHAAGSKDSQVAPPAASPWEYFAAVDYFDTATDSSPNGADYGLSGYGFIAGARTTLSERVRVGGYVAADSGKLDGTLIDADAAGWSLGLFAKALVHERTQTVVSGGLSYGSYSFDGTRGSLIATGGGGWSPASASFSNVDSDALELFLGISSIMYQDHGFRLMPAAGLRYVSGSMDGFAETFGATGSPIALVVDRDSYQHALAELSLRAEADVTASLTLDGLLGVSVGLGDDDPAGLNARFATGSRPFRATAAGLDDDAVFLGLGANWRIRDNFAMGLHWRADFRDDADMENTVGLSTSIRF